MLCQTIQISQTGPVKEGRRIREIWHLSQPDMDESTTNIQCHIFTTKGWNINAFYSSEENIRSEKNVSIIIIIKILHQTILKKRFLWKYHCLLRLFTRSTNKKHWRLAHSSRKKGKPFLWFIPHLQQCHANLSGNKKEEIQSWQFRSIHKVSKHYSESKISNLILYTINQ